MGVVFEKLLFVLILVAVVASSVIFSGLFDDMNVLASEYHRNTVVDGEFYKVDFCDAYDRKLDCLEESN